MPLSPDSAARTRQLANLKRGGQPMPGNQHAIAHGGYARVSRDRVDAKVETMRDALAEDVPVHSAADTLAITELAVKVCQLEDVRANLVGHGYLTDGGEVRPVAELERRLSAQVDDKLDALGMTPRSRAKLGLDLARSIDWATALSEPDPGRRAGLIEEAKGRGDRER